MAPFAIRGRVMARNRSERLPRIGRLVRRFFHAEAANTAIVTAIAAMPIFAGAGLAIDSGRAFVVETRLGKALDSAGLAAGRVVYEDRMANDARAYFAANFPDGLMGSDITADDVAIQVDTNSEFITVSATTNMPTTFMRLFGQDTLQVHAQSVIQRLTRGAEIALVMDNTGSMNGSKITTMKDAAADLVDIVFAGETSYPHLWFSLVPYTSTVNIGAGRLDWLEAGDPAREFDDPADSTDHPFDPSDWKGCVMARLTADRDESDDPPSVQRFQSFLYPSSESDADSDDNNWPPLDEAQSAGNNGTGPNLGCGPAITPLTNQRSEVDAAIDEMDAWHRGGTTSNLGLVWGWRTLSPTWRTVWDGSNRPLSYDAPNMEKVAIVLTDGENQFWDNDTSDSYVSDYTAYGRVTDLVPGATDRGDGLATLDDKFARTCEAMKTDGIVMYTITFGGGATSSRVRDLFRNCASDPGNYFHAPDNGDLRDAFRAIGQELSNLRIVE
jgi:Flp pilus assembly protein TadG